MSNALSDNREPERRVLDAAQISAVVRQHLEFRARRGGKRADFRFCEITRFDLSSVDLSEADFTGAKLSRCRFSGTKLREANLYGADLRGCDFSGCMLDKADMRGACLHGADLTGASMVDVDMREGVIVIGDGEGGLTPAGFDIHYTEVAGVR
ncbi:MAG: pentapeptide repeat-containing protein, partial [Rhodospirillaceae bacterium]|nr:pentapeptide repeat-containing protein [Rhodospirillaceae bacterium]